MSGPEYPNLPDASDFDDEDEFEVSSLRSDADSTSSSSWAALFEADRLARRRRKQIAVVVASGLLALVLIAGATLGVRGGLFGLLTPSATPTVSFSPLEGLFSLLPNPPGVVVTLDGHVLTRLPAPADSQPLQLTPGRHVFAWTSHRFPFAPQRCIVFVPLSSADTCPVLAQHDLPSSMNPLAGHVIALHDSLATLDGDQSAQLTQAIRSALAAARSVATVQPGERYFYYTPGQGGGGGTVSATQPLRATLSFQFDQQTGIFEPCFGAEVAIPCRFPGQDCTQLCTMTEQPGFLGGLSNTWIAAATVSGSWDYTTLGRRVIASNLSDAFALQLAVLSITWDGASWQVTPLFGHIPGLPVTDDAVCDPAHYWLWQNGTWSFVMTNPPGGAQPQFVSDPTPTDGCLAVWTGDGAPAVFLERFGVLLAVNDAAAGSDSGLPKADAGEQRLARQIATQAGVSF